MILQKIKLSSYSTSDGKINIEQSRIPLGSEFWVRANTLMMKEWTLTGEKYLMVQFESGDWMPVEMLEYKSEFQVKQ